MMPKIYERSSIRVRLKEFTVRGTIGIHVGFPFDMLRYDAAWPDTAADALKMAYRGDPRKVVTIKLIGLNCTVERWKSFGWEVIDPCLCAQGLIQNVGCPAHGEVVTA